MDQETPIQHLTFSAPITAADANRRIVSGLVVPFGKVGNTNVGAVVFERGSIAIHDGTKIKLLAQHEPTNPIGRAQSFSTTEDAIYGTFKLSASQKGTDYLIMASEGLIDGLSVGVDVIASKPAKDGTIYVQKAVLREVSLVESAAFEDAKVLQVAAAEGDAEEIAEKVIEETETALIDQISNLVDQLKSIQVSEEALENSETQPESEATVDDSTTAAKPTEAASTEERPTVTASAPYMTTRVRHGIDSKGSYALHKIKAALGDDTSKLWVAAAEDPRQINATFTGDDTSTNPAFSPIQYLTQNFVSNTNFGRSTIDAVSRGVLPAAGMTLSIPSLITSAGGTASPDTAPTVDVTPEGDAPDDTPMTASYLTVDIKKFAGQQNVTLELIERSDPIFMNELMTQLERAYAAATDTYMVNLLTSDGIAATGQNADAAGLQAFIATEAAACYAGSSYFADNLIAGAGQWAAIMSYYDTTGRSLYTASQPWNASGNASNTSIKGNVLGANLFVDKFIPSGVVDDTMFLIASDTVKWWESAQATFSVNIVSSMSVQLAVYGYGAGKVLIPAGVRKWNKS